MTVAAAAFAAAVGTAVLVAWTFDLRELNELRPWLGTMKANTAVGFVLGGLALWRLRRPGGGRRLGMICAAAVIALGGLTALESIFGVDLRIDDLLMAPHGNPSAGRMSLLTDAGFMLVGSALLLLAVPVAGRQRLAQWLALGAALVALLAVIGRLYGVRAFYATDHAEMALHTAITLLVLCIGIFSARPAVLLLGAEADPDSPAMMVTRRLLPATLIGPIFLGWLRLEGQRLDLYDVELGLSLLSLASILYFAALTLWTARTLLRSESERQAIQRSLEQSERSLAITLDSIGDGVLATDAAARIVRMNPVAEKLTGWPLAEARGRPLDEVLRLEDLESHESIESAAARILGPAGGLGAAAAPGNGATLLRRGGEPCVVALSGAPIRSREGDVQGVVLVVRDVTDERNAQAQLLVTDRMVTVGTLAAGVAHEINNPLTAVLTNLSLLELQTASPKPPDAALTREMAAQIRDARDGAERVRKIVRELGVFSRGDEEDRLPVDVRRAVETAVRLTGHEIRQRAQLVLDLREVPLVAGNESRLGQVFLNLIVNAAQAIPEGHADRNAIRISTSTDSAGRVQVDVADTGSGIEPEVMKRLFTPFFTTKPIGTGTGLGLSICKRLVTGMGGAISVESSVGKGTVFQVLLPPAAIDGLPPPPRPGRAPSAPRRARILVIDDEPAIGTAVERLLAPEHDVSTEVAATEALRRIAGGERFDLIFCDLMMPVMTGMDFHAALCQVAPDQAEATVFFTGGAFTPGARAFLDQVPNPRLDKPFDIEALFELVSARVGPR